MGCNKSSSKREVYSNTILPQETRKTSNRQPNFTPKTTGKKKSKKPPKISRRKEIIKIWAEIIEKINKRNNAAAAAAAAKSLQSCPTLCDPIDGSPLGSSVPGIL